MTQLLINEHLPYGATELTPDDMDGLIPKHIFTRKDLDEFEKANIINALLWVRKKNHKYQDILTMRFIFELHKKMFDKTWKWAGQLRRYAVNIGFTAAEQIQPSIKNTLDNVTYWIENSIFPIDEICIRLHHQLVWIHPFPNGNGRFSRIFSDELKLALGGQQFQWGSNDNIAIASKNRTNYINALKLADKKDYTALLKFAIGKNN